MQYLAHAYTKKVTVHLKLKLKFNWAFCISSDNPTLRGGRS